VRKILVILLLGLTLSVLWLWRGRDLVTLADTFKTIETNSRAIDAITYEGDGTGGTLHVADFDLSLNDTTLSGSKPNVGTTKDGELALSFRGNVFPFGSESSQGEKLSADVPNGDKATVLIEHSVLAWPNFFEVNFMTGNSPKWKRYTYQKLIWHKPSGARLEMVWCYEQFYYAQDRWVDALMTQPGATGLIRVEISSASR
jgi:hypothetical protein